MLNLIGKITVRSPATAIERGLKPLDVRTNTNQIRRPSGLDTDDEKKLKIIIIIISLVLNIDKN
jgi:hypothetical protein